MAVVFNGVGRWAVHLAGMSDGSTAAIWSFHVERGGGDAARWSRDLPAQLV